MTHEKTALIQSDATLSTGHTTKNKDQQTQKWQPERICPAQISVPESSATRVHATLQPTEQSHQRALSSGT